MVRRVPMPQVAAAPSPTRTTSIDALRGIVMVVMVLDHARDFFWGFRTSPTDLTTTTLGLFATRWITHFCAPVFVLLAGTSAYLYGRRNGPQRLSRFLLTRGLWLVLLELTVIRLCWIPDPGYHITVLQVIWALGWSMVVLAALCRLPLPAVVIVGAAIVAGHNLLDRFDHTNVGGWQPLWAILHARGRLQPAPGHNVFVSYPVLPWIGVMALGYGVGALFARPGDERRRILVRLGLSAIVVFAVFRGLNLYGNPTPWTPQPRGPLYTVLSFLNCDKYPPSLLYLCMTLGPSLCLLAALDARSGVPSAFRPVLVFGRVPLFFYVGHLVLLRYASFPFALAKWGPAAFKPPPGHAGSPEWPLWVAYVASIAALLLLYPACRWFAAVKQRRRDWWLSYL